MEGLAEDFERLVQIDETIQSLKQQLPRILTKPLTAITAEKVYAKDVQLTVLVPDDNNDDEQDDIVLSQNREELIALSDVLVLATTAAAQANAVWGGGEESTSTNVVQCQLIVDDTMQSIRIPWKTKVPLLGSTNTNNRLEGLSELIFNDSGKLKLHRIRNVTWNGQAVNGMLCVQFIEERAFPLFLTIFNFYLYLLPTIHLERAHNWTGTKGNPIRCWQLTAIPIFSKLYS